MENIARKMRPHSFAEVCGQNSVVSVLSRQIATKTFKNVYLFCGAHGCGKTTVARILASEINNGQGEPIEIDGASNNGVDNIRNLIADAQQSSIDCDYKVYIVDECHQLTRAAWDAALKLIEEPPSNAIFVFCTTNPAKLPDTILSRVQRFDFKKVDKKLIADRLEFIMNEEIKSKYTREALERIANVSDGHVRDAIQMLEKCLDYSGEITLEIVESVLGLVKHESMYTIENGIVTSDLSKCLNELQILKDANADMLQVYDSIIAYAIDCAIYSKTHNIDYTSIPTDYKSKLWEDCPKTDMFVNRLMKFRIYANSSNAEAFLKAVMIEVCGVKA